MVYNFIFTKMEQGYYKFVLATAIILSILLMSGYVFGQPIIYNDQTNLTTGTWHVNCTVSETSANNPIEGNQHYQIIYSGADHWAGWGLNLNNWGSSAAFDFSNFNSLRISYKGLSGNQIFKLALRDVNGFSNELDIGSMTTDYVTIDIPMSAFTAGSSIDISNITELSFSAVSDVPTFSGTLFFDDIVLFNQEINSFTTLETWSRFEKMDKGVNFANWLEAYWLIPFNAFPEVNKYNRTVVQNLIDQGFNSVRLPVCFEIVADENVPYTIPSNHAIWDLIDSTIVWAEDMKFDLIITNHHGYELNNANFQNEIPRKKAIWEQVLSKYGSLNPEKYFFEIYNEPLPAISNGNLHTLMDSVLITIRNMVPEHSVIIGGNEWNSINGLLNTIPYADSNIIYTFHSYDPFSFTHQGMSWTDPPYFPATPFPNNPDDSTDLVNILSAARQFSDLYNVPVMMGEFGVSSAADAESRCNYIGAITSGLKTFDIPWYYWDVISSENAFGFLDNNGEPLSCFAEELKLSTFNDCGNLVTIKENSGEGTLRDQINCAQEGDTILFSNVIMGDTIQLFGLPLFLHKNIYLINQLNSPIIIDISNSNELLYISDGITAYIENIELIVRDSGGIQNSGTLILKDSDIKNISGEEIILNEGDFIIEGEVNVVGE